MGDCDKNLVVVTNASNITIAIRLVGYLHVTCFAHTLNLVSWQALSLTEVGRLMGRVRCITDFSKSTVANHALEQKLKMLWLKTDVSTR